MLIERYTHGPEPVYRRAAERGRLLPEGLRYVDSWVVADEHLDRCFQLMETDDESLLHRWIEGWKDLGTFEIFPVVDSAEAARRVGLSWSGDDQAHHLGGRVSGHAPSEDRAGG